MIDPRTQALSQTQRRFSSQTAGYLLSKYGLFAVLALLLLAAWGRQVVIVILLGLVLSAAGLSRLWSRLSLVGVRCQRSLSEQRVFPDESIELKLRVENRKLLPLPWLELTDEIPAGFATDFSLVPASRPGFDALTRSAPLLWYSGISWKLRLLCKKRGYYPLGPLTVTSGDIFGFYPRSMTEAAPDHIIVYPRLFPVARLDIPSLYPLGETRSEKHIFEDPSRTIGVRDYSPGDSLRRIHWKASARHQELKVRVFEPTTTLKAVLFLAIDSFNNEDDLELGISTAASVANYLVEHGSQAGLLANSRLADSGQPARIPPGGGEAQLVNILEALAKVTPLASASSAEFLENSRSDLPMGTTLLFVLSRPPAELMALLTDLAESGHKVLVLQAGGTERGEVGDGVTWHNVGQPADLAGIGVKENG